MPPDILSSVCPHDCPSACALEVERLGGNRIGRIRGARSQRYTAGVVCAKVARYAERQHHPERLSQPLRRIGEKDVGHAAFAPISWEAALDTVADALTRAAQRHGPGEIAKSDLIVVWGGNPVSAQINLMTHIATARRERGAQLVVIDPYRTETAAQADLHLALLPGADGALACAVMRIRFREGYADRAYLARHTDDPAGLEAHLATRGLGWAAAITGLPEADSVEFARLYGRTRRSYIRFGYGFSRSRNGAAQLFAASCLPAVTGAWAVAERRLCRRCRDQPPDQRRARAARPRRRISRYMGVARTGMRGR